LFGTLFSLLPIVRTDLTECLNQRDRDYCGGMISSIWWAEGAIVAPERRSGVIYLNAAEQGAAALLFDRHAQLRGYFGRRRGHRRENLKARRKNAPAQYSGL